MRLRFAILAYIYIMLAVTVLGQERKRYKVFGNVRDAEGNPIELATVQVKGTIIGQVTNATGYYSLMLNEGDSIELVFKCLGYSEKRRIIPQLTQDTRVNVQMDYIVFEFGEATVTASPRRTDMMESLDPGRVRQLPDATGGSMFTVIGGVRSSYWDYNEEFITSPRLSVGFLPVENPNLVMRFATGIYYQPPFYNDRHILS